ncbi:hypothetical protein IWQ62_003973 [Dispira parvispora]|uniref:Uncharacterized protein n=1 Tax=Dispira parvispora TaxID=1520584 RepID=A0A9W8E2F5_9FUNG|nr:hypothetical protein IWQ62_003973 [Dispira parvispora]
MVRVSLSTVSTLVVVTLVALSQISQAAPSTHANTNALLRRQGQGAPAQGGADPVAQLVGGITGLVNGLLGGGQQAGGAPAPGAQQPAPAEGGEGGEGGEAGAA